MSRDGRIRTGVLLHPMQADSSSLSYIPIEVCVSASCREHGRQSTRRESNPHNSHGKGIGFRYITGA
jgi:hypothetical protein